MKSLDIVLPPAKTELELNDRWRNRLQSNLTRLNRYRKIIEVQDGSITCTGFGRKACERNGEHSWFNHSQDTFRSR